MKAFDREGKIPARRQERQNSDAEVRERPQELDQGQSRHAHLKARQGRRFEQLYHLEGYQR